MERVNRIWNHPLYQQNFRLLLSLEADRKFCRHGLDHCLDVARLACLYEWEAGRQPDREQIYAAALLHDLGRAREYREGIPHDQASRELAAQILPDCGYSEQEQQAILEAIGSHRGAGPQPEDGGPGGAGTPQNTDAPQGADVPQETAPGPGLGALLYRADKESRCCFACPAEPECHWSEEKKNRAITR